MPRISKIKKTKSALKRVAKPTKKLTNLPTLKKTKSTKPSPVDYYNCLLNYSQAGFYDASESKKLKIHACCKKCKAMAPSLNNIRSQELKKLITSYQQVGESLSKLLQPIN
jgi:hypothetical protein